MKYAKLARTSLQHWLEHKKRLQTKFRTHSRAGCFVSYHTSATELRGCVGTIEPTQEDLALEIIENAISAGCRDSRFPPISTDELPFLTLEVSVLTPPQPIAGPEFLDPRRYGIIVEAGWKRGVLLPGLQGIDTVSEQIAIAKRKATIENEETVKLWRFEVEKHHE